MIHDWRDLFDAHKAWTSALHEQGTSVSGSMRIKAFPTDVDPNVVDPLTIYEWPASFPLADVTWPTLPDGPIGGALVEGADADALRELRNRVRDYYYLPASTFFQSQICFWDGPSLVYIELDDAVPFEDEYGIVPRKPQELLPPGF